MCSSPSSLKYAALLCAPLLALGAASGCKCSGKLTDEERLKKRINAAPVYMYVATKVAITKAGDDPEIKKARESLMALFQALSKLQHGPGEGETRSELSKLKGALSIGEIASLVKAVWKLKKTGERIVKEGKDDELKPLLPLLLAQLEAPAGLIKAAEDRNTDHALFLLVTSILKIHPKSPVPLPPEIVLYEAWSTDAAALKIPGLSSPVHSLKAWTYGSNDLCDLAQKEANALELNSFKLAAMIAAMRLVSTDPPDSLLKNLEKVDAGLRAFGHAGVAVCHLKRGHDKQARPSLKRTVDMLQKLGASQEDLAYIRTFIDCGGEKPEVVLGMARLAELEKGAARGDREDLDALRAYCEASDETSSELARKISLSGKILRVAMRHIKKHDADKALANSPLFKAVGGFASVCELTTRGAEGVTRSVEGVKEGARGLLKKLRE